MQMMEYDTADGDDDRRATRGVAAVVDGNGVIRTCPSSRPLDWHRSSIIHTNVSDRRPKIREPDEEYRNEPRWIHKQIPPYFRNTFSCHANGRMSAINVTFRDLHGYHKLSTYQSIMYVLVTDLRR